MKKKCLILNNREPFSQEILNDLSDRLEATWYQNAEPFDLVGILKTYRDTQILVTTYMDLQAANLKILPELEAIITLTTAVEYVDREYCRDRNIRVMNTANYAGQAVAEHAIALALCVARKLIVLDRKVREKDFQCFEDSGVELGGKQAGIIGLGGIGMRVAAIAKGFGMRVVHVNRSPKFLDGSKQVNLDDLLATSDFIFITVPSNAETRGSIGRREFAMMKPNAILVNTSPENIVDMKAMTEALESKKIWGAGIDLLSADEAYLKIPNLVITPRHANATQECTARRIATWTGTLASYLSDHPMNVVV